MWSHATLLRILRRQFQQFQLPMSQHLDQQSFRALAPEDITVVTANHALSFMPRDATMVPCVCSATSAIDLRRKGGRRQRELLSKEVHDADLCRCSPQQDLKRQKLFLTCGLQILCYGYFAGSIAGILYCTNSLDLMSVHSGRQQFPKLHAVFQPDLVSTLREFMRSFAAAHYVHQGCGLKVQRKSSDRTAELLADVSGKLVPLSSQLYRPCGP